MTFNNKANRIPPVSDGTATDAVTANNTPMMTPPPSDLSCIRLDKPRSLYRRRNDDGLDWLRKPSNDLPSGAISKSIEIGIPDSAGGFTTVSSDELYRNTQEEIQTRRMIDERYNGVDPYGATPGGGLSVSGRGRRSDNDSDNSNNSGLNV